MKGSINKLIQQIFVEGGNDVFFSFSNADGKQWIIPARDTKTALNLYQPSSLKGKLVKSFFPVFKNIKLVRSKLGVELKFLNFADELSALLVSLYKEKPEFSVFCGTPSIHQKITIQLSKDSKILGYCKVTDREDIKAIFRHEQYVLGYLRDIGITQIPQCIYCGKLQEDTDVFIQTSIKTSLSKISHDFGKQHWEFLKDLHLHTTQSLPFEQSDFSHMLKRLDGQLHYFSPQTISILNKSIKKVQQHFKEKTITFSAYHADFTPWNMFVEQQKLFVFDFEYASLTYPPYLDYFHFLTQTGIYTKQWKAERIWSDYKKRKRELGYFFTEPDFYYLCYLLDVLERYLNRSNSIQQNENEINIWISLISNLIQTFPDETIS